MARGKKFRLSRIFTNNWVVTLTATLVGVFVALYLNEWAASRNLKYQKSIATQNILSEISSNQEKLNEVLKQHNDLYDILSFLGNYIDEEENFIVLPDTLNRFRQKFPELIVISDSTELENGYFDYDGEINIDISFPHFDLTTISWETLKNSGIGTTYGFECLMFLESMDKITQEILVKNIEFLDYFTGSKDSGPKNEYILKHLQLLIDYEYSLNAAYAKSKEELADCR